MHDLAFGELALAFGSAQRRATSQHDEELLGAVMKVVDVEVPGAELVNGRAKPHARADEALRLPAAARPVLRVVPVVAKDVHAACCGSGSSSSHCSGRGITTRRRRSRRRSSRSSSDCCSWRSSLIAAAYDIYMPASVMYVLA